MQPAAHPAWHAAEQPDAPPAARPTAGPSLGPVARRPLLLAAALGAAALLGGCASTGTLSADVSSFGEWPADRKPASYAFDRLPSQQQRADEVAQLEAALAPALKKAGFTPAAEGAQPDVLVQVGARSSYSDPRLWADPVWWRGGVGYWRYGPWVGPRWNMSLQFDMRRYDREVAVLIRDRASGKPLYEARASAEGSTPSASAATLGALFEAALIDFPRTGLNPRTVQVPLAR